MHELGTLLNIDEITVIQQTKINSDEKLFHIISPLTDRLEKLKDIDRKGRTYKFELFRIDTEADNKRVVKYYQQFRRPRNHVMANEYAQEDDTYGLLIHWKLSEGKELILLTGKRDIELYGASPAYFLADPLLIEAIKADLEEFKLT